MENDYIKNIGKRVRKKPVNLPVIKEPKPFKSGFKINTVKGVINHPILNVPAYTFYEDNSFVECRRCEVVEKITLISFSECDHYGVFDDYAVDIKDCGGKIVDEQINPIEKNCWFKIESDDTFLYKFRKTASFKFSDLS